MTLKIDGNSLSAGEVNYKTIAIKNSNFYTDKATGYVYWTAGHIIVNGTEYTLSASNSGASQTDKHILATLTDSGSTAAISFAATSSTITDPTIILIGYVDASSRLSLTYARHAQPDLSGYTITKSTSNINVNGEGYLLSAFGMASQTGGYATSTSSMSSSTRIQVSIDSATYFDETDTMTLSNLGGVNDSAHSAMVCAGIAKFNSNLTVTVTLTNSSAGTGANQVDTHTKQVILYAVK